MSNKPPRGIAGISTKLAAAEKQQGQLVRIIRELEDRIRELEARIKALEEA